MAFFAGESAKKFNNRIAAWKFAVAFALFSINVSKSAYIHSYTLINDEKNQVPKWDIMEMHIRHSCEQF